MKLILGKLLIPLDVGTERFTLCILKGEQLDLYMQEIEQEWTWYTTQLVGYQCMACAENQQCMPGAICVDGECEPICPSDHNFNPVSQTCIPCSKSASIYSPAIAGRPP